MESIQLKLLYKTLDDIRHQNGVEYWYARELFPLLGYTRWENFNTERDIHCGYRLDHFLVSSEYVQHVQTISVLTHWRSMPSPSDHAPVSMIFNPTH